MTAETTASTRLGRVSAAMSRNRQDLIALGAILLVALGLRVAYLAFGTGSRPLESDANQYYEIARNLALGHGFSMHYPGLFVHETAFRPPGYPALLGLFFFVFGPSAGLARGLNVVLGLVVISLAYVLLRRYVGFLAAVVAAAALAITPNLIANDTYALDEPLSLCLILCVTWALLARRWWLAGLSCGLLVLTRPSAQALIVVLAIWILITADWRALARVVLVALIVVSPWIVRNWIQVGVPVVVTSNGFNWAAIYSPAAQRAGGFIDPTLNPAYNGDRLLQFDESAWSSFLQSQGTHALEANPGYVLHVLKENFLALSDLQPGLNDPPDAIDGRDLTVVHDTRWLFYAELLAGLAGLATSLRRPLTQLLSIQAAYFVAISMLFIAVPRLRAPLDLTLGMGIGLGADALRRWRSGADLTGAEA
jgi:4-amino-4-deoxy-L-arabinose transferase-like glycosyltransferase